MTKRNQLEPESRIGALITVLLLSGVLSSVAGLDLATDTKALIAFRDVHDPRGTKLQWTNSTWTCNWRGITCVQNRVTEVRLPGKGFRGSIPPESLSLLSELRVVSLRGNRLTGDFPGELWNCKNVEALFLAGNDFFGHLPVDISGFWPRLSHLGLEYNRLDGTIPESIGQLSKLTLLNLLNNSFSGSIPSLTQLNLTAFNVANNDLSGPVPASLSRFPATSFLGNPGLCGPPLTSLCPSPITEPTPSPVSPTAEPDKNPVATSGHSKAAKLSAHQLAGIVVGGIAILALVLAALLFCLSRTKKGRQVSLKSIATREVARERTRDSSKGMEENGDEYTSSTGAGELERNKLVFFEGKKYSFNLEDLLRASAEVLGKGSVGTAYKAILEDGTIMAVKRLKDVTTGKKEFEAQIQVVGKLQHRNLVPLRAFYFSKDEKLLVYDFMPMGSLSALLHGNRGSSRTPLDWESRVKIALGAARGLDYLHAQGGPKFVHANIKSSNILLDKDLEACISDFGLAQLLTPTSAASRVVGYRAPEVTETRKITQKSDVYSFGVLLLELLTGKAPTQAALNDEGIDLPRWVQSVVREEWTAEVFDLELMRYQNIEEEMVAMLQIAMQCVDPVPERRPKMNNVLLLLEDVHPFFIDNGDEMSRQSETRSESASEDKFRGSSDKDRTSQENTPSHSHTP